MRVCLTPYWLQKAGLAPSEFEDAYFPWTAGEYVGDTLRFAAADGATEGVLSAAWAQVLAETYCQAGAWPAGLGAFLEKAGRGWAAAQERYLKDAEAHGGVPWYVEEGLRTGAFATLLGLTLSDRGEEPAGSPAGSWEAFAVGDSCLFQVRDRALLGAFPLHDAADFGNRPVLLGSNPAFNQPVRDAVRTTGGEWRGGDTFYLATDALAAWLLGRQAAGEPAWPALRDLKAQAFAEWVRELQRAGELRNDDVTLVRLDIL